MSEDDHARLRPYAQWVMKRKKRRQRAMPDDWPVHVKWAVIVLTAEYYRRYHADRSERMISDSGLLGQFTSFDMSFHRFIPERIQIMLGRIAGMHGKEFDDIFSLPKGCRGIGLSDDIACPRRVAALLRLGDLLDTDNGRFDENAYTINGKVPETTYAHQKKHASLRHFLVTSQGIEVAFDCPDEDTYKVASDWLEWLKKETEQLALQWHRIMNCPLCQGHFGRRDFRFSSFFLTWL